MALLFKSNVDRADWWRRELNKYIPDLEVRIWPDIGDRDDIKYALCWKMPHGELATFNNLQAVYSLGAGVDHLLSDPDFPRHLPFSRVVDPNLTGRMTEYVVQHVLNHHRFEIIYDNNQQQKIWKEEFAPFASDRKVGILGMGELGGDAASALTALNFDVAGWSRSEKKIDGVTSFFGKDQLDAFLARTEILVCLLPLTAATTDFLNADLFAKLPKGASIINAGRGPHVVDEDLIAALNSDHLSAATLDVFRIEPLPEEHPFWEHPKIRITPHVASISDPESVAKLVAQNIIRTQNGEELLYAVDVDKGY
ncbi:glyoxylate/hydroxypyruvate reductase A [Sneathiella marina]|uniref:Glyoxylate/hydroxypyruvate reductase A n=1 Tax=Sneathiella marina TaxID=2950108 RepID=A0ABY4W3H3_9PROT|nr:glyoxylate/hydroxypyruvate reductase A [Sneathiella marina]USG61731.1 glyoxylate/hydroxypyruvate reductase A [Sneathiella marina]